MDTIDESFAKLQDKIVVFFDILKELTEEQRRIKAMVGSERIETYYIASVKKLYEELIDLRQKHENKEEIFSKNYPEIAYLIHVLKKRGECE